MRCVSVSAWGCMGGGGGDHAVSGPNTASAASAAAGDGAPTMACSVRLEVTAAAPPPAASVPRDVRERRRAACTADGRRAFGGVVHKTVLGPRVDPGSWRRGPAAAPTGPPIATCGSCLWKAP
jgi:hypothetical protein